MNPDDPPVTKKRKIGGGKGRGKGRARGGGAGSAAPGMHVVVSGQCLFYPYELWLSYVQNVFRGANVHVYQGPGVLPVPAPPAEHQPASTPASAPVTTATPTSSTTTTSSGSS